MLCSFYFIYLYYYFIIVVVVVIVVVIIIVVQLLFLLLLLLLLFLLLLLILLLLHCSVSVSISIIKFQSNLDRGPAWIPVSWGRCGLTSLWNNDNCLYSSLCYILFKVYLISLVLMANFTLSYMISNEWHSC